jgi:hypothetical protein
VDEIARIFLAQRQIVFFVWVTFGERKWSILAERRRNMAARQHAAYELFAASGARSISADSATVNQAMYQVLCHETHAHPRLESFGIIRDDESEIIKVDRRPRNLQVARKAVMGGTELAVWEAVLGLRWQRTGAV